MSRARPAGRLAWQQLEHWTLHVNFLTNFFFILAMLIGTIDFNHFTLFSLILTVPGGHKVSAKQNLFTPLSSTVLV